MNTATTQTVLEAYIAFQLYSALVQSLPPPSTYGGVWYRAVYNFLTILAADFKSYISSKVPSSSQSTSETLTQVQPSGAVSSIKQVDTTVISK